MTSLSRDDLATLRAARDHGDPHHARRRRGINAVSFDALLRRLRAAGLLEPAVVDVDGAPFHTLALTPRGAAALA